VLAWGLAIAYFWLWWLQPHHNIGTTRFVLNSAVLGWFTLVPLYLLSLYIRGRLSAAEVDPPTGRAAMVVTKAASEPWSVVRETLVAMLAQEPHHDTWLADEDPAQATIAWCNAHGVGISTRKGVAAYHRASWPRRTRCKEGNLAYFYDRFGYDLYDFVVQMDADHVPAPGYLREMLKPFSDPRVGYVSAPSICDKNAADSWSARGRLHVEATVHGLLQAAYTNGWAPLCIGSHYAVRTKALREIGGLGPKLAEDHSTSLMMNAHGWRGVHAFNAIAHGDGASTFPDLITQEFQWSRSLLTILLQHTGTYLSRLPLALKFQFLFCQLWYSLFSLFMLLTFIMPRWRSPPGIRLLT
jgi:cellulose synthase/poly-beta-1,6-N-acetylglucosamine synthase-like glycosyltransferase